MAFFCVDGNTFTPNKFGGILGGRLTIYRITCPKMKLTNTSCSNSKPKDKTYKMADGGGMYLEITPSGGKLWRLKYRFGGKEKLLSLGKYPHLPIKGPLRTGKIETNPLARPRPIRKP